MKKICFLFAVGLLLLNTVLLAQESLPVGTHPTALQFDHFPGKVYAVVWRNWNLVPVSRIAQTIQATPAQVRALAVSMGLPPERNLSPDFDKRIYITVIRRNWHLLPYHQLLTLLDISETELAIALKEDDFLFVKLGNLKPDCAPVLYAEPDETARRRLAAIKKLAVKYFSAGSELDEQPFDFVTALAAPGKEVAASVVRGEQLRYIYSYFGVFGDPLIDTLHDPYPEGLLAKLAEKGVTGVWMHVVLNQLAPGGEQFPEFGKQHEQRIANLRRIALRAKKYGISIYLYMNEPRAMPPAFFSQRQDMMGAIQGSYRAMCTAHPAVVQWMTSALQFVFRQVPELGGVFTITASENHTHCASHNNQATCPRCSKRGYAEIIADVNRIIATAVHSVQPAAKVIAWDWGWHNHGLAKDVIDQLPKDVWLMSVSEWAKEIDRGGIASRVGEYAISAVGPGARSRQHWAWAQAAGLKTVAKVQFNNTWELSAVPWIPATYLVAQHAANLAGAGTSGLMLSWSLGGYPSPNLEIAKAFADNPSAKVDEVLSALATSRYGNRGAAQILKGWKGFSDAFSEFPYHIGTVYTAPLQYGPSNLLYFKPTGYKATMVGLPYDDLQSWRSIYPPEVFIGQLKKVAAGWQQGLQAYQLAAPLLDNQKQKTNWREEANIAKAAWLHFAATANQAEFVRCRDSLFSQAVSVTVKKKLKKRINTLLTDESRLAGELLAVCRLDSRIGFEASNQYYYVVQDLVEKVLNCHYLQKLFAAY